MINQIAFERQIGNIFININLKLYKFHNINNLGSEYINGYNKIITLALRCNHDFQHLTNTYYGCDSIYYIFKYTFKKQETIDSRAATTLATFNNRIIKEKEISSDEITDEILARRRIAALAMSGSNKQEIALPLCALYLLYESSARFSHDFVNLYFGQYINILTSNQYKTLLLGTYGNNISLFVKFNLMLYFNTL